MTRRNWGLATLIAGVLIVMFSISGQVGVTFFLGLVDPSVRAVSVSLSAWWLGAVIVVGALSLVFFGIALLVSFSKSQKSPFS